MAEKSKGKCKAKGSKKNRKHRRNKLSSQNENYKKQDRKLKNKIKKIARHNKKHPNDKNNKGPYCYKMTDYKFSLLLLYKPIKEQEELKKYRETGRI